MTSINLGAAIYVAVKPVLKIYVIIAVGYLLARYNIVTVETSRGVSNMVVNAILPCLTFNKIVGNISDKDIKEVGVIVLTALLMFCTGGVVALCTKWATRAPQRWTWGLLFAGIFPNISDLPIAYVQSMNTGSIFSTDQVNRGVAYCCIFLASQSFLMMNFGMFRLVGLDFREQTSDEEHGSQGVSDSLSSHSLRRLSSKKEPDAPSSLREQSFPIRENSLSDNETGGMKCRDYPHRLPLAHTANRYFPDLEPERTDTSAVSTLSSESSISWAPSHKTAPAILHNVTKGQMTRCRSSTWSRERRGSIPQTTEDIVNEYSVASRMKSGEVDLSKPLSLTQEIGAVGSRSLDDNCDLCENLTQSGGNMSLRQTRSQLAAQPGNNISKLDSFIQKYKLGWLMYILVNFCRPASLGALLGIICSMIPWVKALFVHTDVHMHQAPDGQPVLNFLMDFTGYVGNACVPLGLLLLGGTLARLKVTSLPKGFWKTVVVMTVFRLMILPIIGVAWANKLRQVNWLENEVAVFITVLTWAMPSATAQVYFTAFYTPLEGDHLQMDCLSVLFMSQYLVLFITLSFVVTYTLKVTLKL
ncbi:LAMI_0H17788g1_1 [Lachancea mirantina]|uniref:LAMI_0H17788g1_1 n=1 Tax=Lachancea mirantina TaxID=1230905 RepID=A0A1G4KJK8_9SACH|nr:LAMI_0H17788g1_1 [Lachancea mirantina]